MSDQAASASVFSIAVPPSITTYTPVTPSSLSSSPSHSTNSTNQTRPSTSPAKPQIEDPSETLTTHTFFLFLAFFALFFILQIPRSVAAFLGERRGRSQWGWPGLGYSNVGDDGGYSGYGGGGEKYGYPPAPTNVPRDVNDGEDDEKEEGSGEGYPRKMEQHPHRSLSRKASGRSGGRKPRKLNLPPHVPAYYPSFLRALAVPLRMRFPYFITNSFVFLFSLFTSRSSSNSSSKSSSHSNRNKTATNAYTLGQIVVLTIYTLPLLYVTFAFRSNPLTDGTRTGFIGVLQVPIAVFLASKNGLLSLLLAGSGYEKVNWFHRWVGRVAVLGVNAHCWRYFYAWTIAGTFSKSIAFPSNTWGLVGLIALNLMFVFSFKSVRERAYGFFLVTHLLGFGVLLVGIYKHKPTLLPYVLTAVGLYGLDHLIRLVFKTRITRASLIPLPSLDMARIEIPKLNRGWRAGQHVRVYVLDPESSGVWGVWGLMGGLVGRQMHPLTIASVEGNEEGMVLMCKRVGGWSGWVYDLAKGGRYNLKAHAHRDREDGGDIGKGRNVRLIVEGPYGGVGNANVASFSAAVYVCGGSGITFALSSIEELVQKDARGESRVKLVELVWVVPDPGCLEPILPTFTDLIHQSRSVGTPLRISVFYTRAPTGKQPAYFDAVEASPFVERDPSPTIVQFHTPSPHTPTRENSSSNPHPRQPSHTLISPVSEDAQAFAAAYQQRLENQRSKRARPPPSQRPAGEYEAPRVAPAPPPPSAYNDPKSKKEGPQRQDSNASARTLVDASAFGARKSSLKRTNTSKSAHPPLTQRLPTNLTLAPGRPRLSHFLEHALDRALRLSRSDLRDEDDYPYSPNDYDPDKPGKIDGKSKLCGMVVAVCGPAGLAEDVCGAVAGLEWERTQRVGGVEVVEEVFGC